MDSYSMENMAKLAFLGALVVLWAFGAFCGYCFASVVNLAKIFFPGLGC